MHRLCAFAVCECIHDWCRSSTNCFDYCGCSRRGNIGIISGFINDSTVKVSYCLVVPSYGEEPTLSLMGWPKAVLRTSRTEGRPWWVPTNYKEHCRHDQQLLRALRVQANTPRFLLSSCILSLRKFGPDIYCTGRSPSTIQKRDSVPYIEWGHEIEIPYLAIQKLSEAGHRNAQPCSTVKNCKHSGFLYGIVRKGILYKSVSKNV